MKTKTMAFAAALLVAALPVASRAAARSNEGGTYTYSGSPADNRTTGQTGDQTYTIASPVTIGSFFPGQTDIVDYWQIYTGAKITTSGNDRIMKGNVVFENEVEWAGTAAEGFIGYTGPAKLWLRNGGSLTATGHDIRIGQSYNSGTAGNATVFMDEPSLLAGASGKFISVGNQLPGALWMDGGTVSLANAIFYVGDGDKTIDGGYVRLNGGEISLRAEGGADKAFIGTKNSYSSVHVSGGEMRTKYSGVLPNEVYFKLGSGSSTAADFFVDGGFVDLGNDRLGIGYWNSNVRGGRASLTVAGDGRFRLNLPVMGRTGSGNVAVLNLNGGRFELTRGFTTYGNAGNTYFLNFDGGTAVLDTDSRTSGYTGELGISAMQHVVYPGGATVEVPSGIVGKSSANLRKADGWGVSEITLTAPGSGYVTAPKVTLSGGSGSYATAYAILGKDRTLAKIVVTCRGEGYAEGDEVAVAIDSATGSGAAATATLAPNGGGVIRKTGAGTLQITGDNAFDGDVEIAEGVVSLNGAGFTAASSFGMDGGTVLRSVKGSSAALNRLDVRDGIVEIRGEGASGTGTVALGDLTVERGLALVTHTNGLALALSSAAATAASSAASPVVNGLVYANKDSSSYRSPSLFERAADGTLSLVETTGTPGPDANWTPPGGTTAATAVNSVVMPLSPGVNAYVASDDPVEIKSGMIVFRRPHEDLQRFGISGSGAFTTRAPGGMFIYGDTYDSQPSKRSNSRADSDAVYIGATRRLLGPFADPDASTPMTITVAGEKKDRPEKGFAAWLLGEQSFSGGLNLVNGGVVIQGDSGLGAAGSPVTAVGYCAITSYEWTFGISSSHPIEIRDGGALIFSPTWGNQGNTVASALSGSGALLTSDVNRSGYAMAFTGDHSAFTGNYYVQGHARIAPATFSPLAGISLADGTNGVGVIETSGAFTRPAGTGKGEIRWKRFAAYPSSFGLRGGFAAYGGDLSVNLGGAGAKLVPGSEYLPAGAVIQLQSQYADGALALANGFELGGAVQKISVWTGKTATLSGAVSDAAGGGRLAVDGDIAFAGTFEIAAANVPADPQDAAPMLSVDGDLAFGATATVRVDPSLLSSSALSAYAEGGLPLASCTGEISGIPALDGTATDAGWHLGKRGGTLLLKRARPFVLVVR